MNTIAIARRGGRARLKASDSKSDRGVSPSGVQILSPPPLFLLAVSRPDRRAPEPCAAAPTADPRRGDRAAEGAALEMPCTGNPCAAGSNPAPSAIFYLPSEPLRRAPRLDGRAATAVGRLRRSTVGRRPPWVGSAARRSGGDRRGQGSGARRSGMIAVLALRRGR